jgi:hypothetical protein
VPLQKLQDRFTGPKLTVIGDLFMLKQRGKLNRRLVFSGPQSCGTHHANSFDSPLSFFLLLPELWYVPQWLKWTMQLSPVGGKSMGDKYQGQPHDNNGYYGYCE